jgi:hypothetical protein
VITPLAEEVRPWEDIPGAVLVGVAVGVVLLVAAIRAMFGKKGK